MGKKKEDIEIQYREQKAVAWDCPKCKQWNCRAKPFDMNELTCEACGFGTTNWKKIPGGFEVY